MRSVETIRAIRSYVTGCRKKDLSIGLVPTMGAFHEGHLSLIRQARKDHDIVIVSIFVNPIQFSVGEDFNEYPRKRERDRRMAGDEGVDVIFAPSVAEMYPRGFDSYVDQENLSSKLCGKVRPGHFRGVMTVVTKLLNIVRPDAAYFGQKDYQQALIIRRTVTDLNLDAKIVVLPIIREEDGLAMSSRNAYLGEKRRKDALCLHRALEKAGQLVNSGVNSAARIQSEMRKVIQRVKGARIDYIEIVNATTLDPVREIKGKTLVALAVRLGKTRLIDNVFL